MSVRNNEELPAELASILDFVQKDLSHGANDLAGICLEQCQQVMLANDKISKQRWLQLLTALTQCRESMVPLRNVMFELREYFSALPELAFTSDAVLVLRKLIREFRHRNVNVARYGADLIFDGATVMTISRSSAVTAAFMHAKKSGKQFCVIQLAGAPGNEGYIAARELDHQQIFTELITDAQAGLFVEHADIVMVGCDSWLADDYFVNKAGTYPLALLAKAHNKPLWVLADRYKNSDQDHQYFVLEEIDTSELKAPEGKFIKPRNIYFESVSCRLVTGRVTESGCERLH